MKRIPILILKSEKIIKLYRYSKKLYKNDQRKIFHQGPIRITRTCSERERALAEAAVIYGAFSKLQVQSVNHPNMVKSGDIH